MVCIRLVKSLFGPCLVISFSLFFLFFLHLLWCVYITIIIIIIYAVRDVMYVYANKNSSISNCYKKHENEKKRAYEQRIRNIEHSSFTPLVVSATGGMAKQSTTFYKRLASLLADKWEQPYSSTLYWLRVRLAFSLLRSAIQCIRGARSSRGHAEKSPLPIDLISREASLQ